MIFCKKTKHKFESHLIWIPSLFLICSLVTIPFNLNAQKKYYFVAFKDKQNNLYRLEDKDLFLSKRSIERRNKQSIPIDSLDIPVSMSYIHIIERVGGTHLFSCKWMNGAVFSSTDSLFESKVKATGIGNYSKRVRKRSPVYDTLSISSIQSEESQKALKSSPSRYGLAFPQIRIHRGEYLHALGFKGNGILIAQLDAGYRNLNTSQMLSGLKIEGYKDFVHYSPNISPPINKGATHGSYVLSAMGSNVEGVMIGTAPDASYLLINTENDTSEFPLEEFSWIAGIEYADSFGADVLNSSLGYSTFDSTYFNHSYQDMDGLVLEISRAANIATKKGMIVCVSAGNEGNKVWKYITSPADAKGVITVGAVDTNSVRAGFSSIGPTIDGRIKPDVVAVGRKTVCASLDNIGTINVDGTSLAAPIITGLVACLWQAFPEKTALEIKQAIFQSSSKFYNKDNEQGNGIPDFWKAYQILSSNFGKTISKLKLYEDYLSHQLRIEGFKANNDVIAIQIIDMAGNVIYSKNELGDGNRFIKITVPDYLWISHGVYIIQVGKESVKWIK